MTLLNKTIAQGLDLPWTVLLAQNIGTVLIGYLHSYLCGNSAAGDSTPGGGDGSLPTVLPNGNVQQKRKKLCGMRVPRAFRNKLWVLLQVVLFMTSLFFSLRSLRFISVPLYVVARNTVPAQTAFLEWSFTGLQLSAVSIFGLLCTIIGAALYTFGDMQSGLALDGFFYALLLTSIVAANSVVDKTAVRLLGREEDIKPVECNQIRVALSLPVNILFVLASELPLLGARDAGAGAAAEAPLAAPELGAALPAVSRVLAACILLSTVFGFGMGTFNFYLQQSVSAATVQVANILYKLCTTMISRVTHPAPVAPISWLGFALSLAGIGLYTLGPKRQHYAKELEGK